MGGFYEKDLFILLLFLSYSVFTLTITIPTDQSTIEAEINASVIGDTVLVQQVTFKDDINYNGKNITVESLFLTTQDLTYISQIIIEGSQQVNYL